MTIANRDQAEHWNSRDEPDHWVKHQNRYDGQLEPYASMILDAAGLDAGEAVLDIGCGCGATSRAAARLVDPGQVVGVDLSVPMLDRARSLSESEGITNTTFIDGDAQVHPFDPQSFDAVISRFGVMFFSEPVDAFTNMRRTAKDSGRLVFVSWQALTHNEWLIVPAMAAAEFVVLPEPTPPNSPGMFGLSDPDWIRDVLDRSGWQQIEIESVRTPMLLGGGGSLDDTIEFLRTGSIGRTLLKNADTASADRAVEAVRDALAPRVDSDGVSLGTAVWLVKARA
jgi:SAM-dependent methyltransferase